MSKGKVYFARNPAFGHLIKIGITTKDSIEDRGLSGSNVPEDFEYLYWFECDDHEKIEKLLHKNFNQYRHITETGRLTEFFYSKCIPDIIELLKVLQGVKETTDEDTEIIIKNNGNNVRSPIKTFKEANIKIGEKVKFIIKDFPEQEFEVANEKTGIIYNGEIKTMSNVAMDITKDGTKQGSAYFFYNGKSISQIVDENRL
jgi:hypothetical protein